MALDKVTAGFIHILSTNKANEVVKMLYPELAAKGDLRKSRKHFDKWLGEYEHYVDYYTMLYHAAEGIFSPSKRFRL